jgi:hypothetical protein
MPHNLSISSAMTLCFNYTKSTIYEALRSSELFQYGEIVVNSLYNILCLGEEE